MTQDSDRANGLDWVWTSEDAGLAVISADGDIEHLNPAGERILSEGDCLSVANGRLAVAYAGDIGTLRDIVVRRHRRRTTYVLRNTAGKPSVSLDVRTSKSDSRLRLLRFRRIGLPLMVRLAPAAALFGLTRTEQRIVARLLQAKDVAEIAALESCAPDTVRTHTRNVYRKLGVSSRSELFAMVLAAIYTA